MTLSTWMKWLIVVPAAVFAASCGLQGNSSTVCVSGVDTGNPVATLLLERLSGGVWDPVALVHGFPRDYDACMDIAEAMKKQWTGRRFICMPGNEQEPVETPK